MIQHKTVFLAQITAYAKFSISQLCQTLYLYANKFNIAIVKQLFLDLYCVFFLTKCIVTKFKNIDNNYNLLL